MIGPVAYVPLVADVAGVPDYINLAEGAGYGSPFATVVAVVGGVLTVSAAAAALVVGVRWLRQRFSSDSSPPVRILPQETRQRVRKAVQNNDFIAAGDLLARAGEEYEAADAYLEGGAYERAAQMFEQIDSLPRALDCYKQAGRYDQVGRIYEKLDRPRAAAAEYARGDVFERAATCYGECGDDARAGEYHKRAGAYLKAADAYDRAGEPLKAAELYAQHVDSRITEGGEAVEEIPDQQRERAKRAAELFRDAGKNERASEVFLAAGYPEEAAETLKVSGNYTQAAEMLVDAEKPELAAKFLEEAGEANEAALMRAESALEAGDIAEAAREFREAGKIARAAELFEEAGEFNEAAGLHEQLEEYEQAMELYLEVPRYGHAARCAELDDRLAPAAEYYREAGDIDGELRALKQAGDYFRAGRLEFEHRRYEDALETLEKIDSRDANYTRSLELQGDVFRAQDRAEKAYSRYRSAMGNRDAQPSTLPLLYKMGRALEDEPDLAGALDCYNKVVEIDEHFEDAGLRIKAIRKQMRRGTLSGRSTTGRFSTLNGEGEEAAERFEIVDEIARGGMGIVYKARDTVLGRTVAFKTLGENLRDNETAVDYFLREARAAAALSHPNIVTIYDVGEQRGEYYMAMEYVEGTTLKELIERTGALSDDKVRYILKNCCRALEYAHDKGVIHRDIKSGNVMTTRDKALKVMDFGLAKFLKEYQNDHTQQVGTPFYMSPEQIIGEDIDFRSDLYGLGCTVFECATGTVPFFKGDLSYHHIHTEPPEPRSINPGISPELEALILKLLEKDPDHRFQSAGEVLEQLDS